MADLEQKSPTALFHARTTYFDAQKKAVDAFIDTYLLDQAAQKENMTVEQLLDKYVTQKIDKDPSEDALKVYYEGLESAQPFEALREQIIQHIRQTRMDKVKAAYMKSLHEQAKVAIHLATPRAPVSLVNAAIRGDVNAPVMIVEYADYECPYCQVQQPALEKVEAEFKGKVAMVFKDTPLPMHSHAKKAAEAARCAGDQGKYWEYHDMLFQTKKLEVAQLKESARTLQLDGEAFDKCLDSGTHTKPVMEQLAEAGTLQLEGTPSIFINGRFFNGGLSYEQLKSIIEEELAAAAKTVNTASAK